MQSGQKSVWWQMVWQWLLRQLGKPKRTSGLFINLRTLRTWGWHGHGKQPPQETSETGSEDAWALRNEGYLWQTATNHCINIPFANHVEVILRRSHKLPGFICVWRNMFRGTCSLRFRHAQKVHRKRGFFTVDWGLAPRRLDLKYIACGGIMVGVFHILFWFRDFAVDTVGYVLMLEHVCLSILLCFVHSWFANVGWWMLLLGFVCWWEGWRSKHELRVEDT